jgi:hypothetical protein
LVTDRKDNLRCIVRRRSGDVGATPLSCHRNNATMPVVLHHTDYARDVLEKISQDVDDLNEELKAAGAWVFAGGCTHRAPPPWCA